MSSATRRILERQMTEIRCVFAGPLAARLGRPLEEIRDEGLGAFDFKTNEEVELTLCDGSTMSLRYAFFVVEPAQDLVGLFSEHCGYYFFGAASIRCVRQLQGGVEIARFPDGD